MQRKLSEIAEIPKILSSTLATVSQTFDKLMPNERKYSYDEDAHDFELLRDNRDSIESESKLSTLKSNSPESDYDSESNYTETDEDEVNNDDYEEEYVSEIEETVTNGAQSQQQQIDEDSDEDFLTTTFTWNLRKIPKLCVSEVLNINNVDDEDEHDNQEHTASDDNANNNEREDVVISQQIMNTNGKQLNSEEMEIEDNNVKLDKHDKFERAWPWADRQKIIYKQSTCHLVPRKPLGLVEQRIQLLAKQHLVDKLEKASGNAK